MTRILIPAAVIEHAPLEAVYIFFDTATYDQIERDVKVGDKVRHYEVLPVAMF